MGKPAEHHPDYRKNEYSIRVVCMNCGTSYFIFVEMGVLVSRVIEYKACAKCGCIGTLKIAL